MKYIDKVILREVIHETAWRKDTIEFNTNESRVKGVRILGERGWGIYSTTKEVAWKEIEEKALALSRIGGAKKPPELAPVKLYHGRVVLGKKSKDPTTESIRLITIGKGLLEEKGLTGEVIVVYTEQEKMIEHPEGTAQEEKNLTEMFIFSDIVLQGKRGVGSHSIAVIGSPTNISPREIERAVEISSRRALWSIRSKQLSPLERGQKTVILGGETSGAFFHEVSHLMEADQPDHLGIGTLVSTRELVIKDDPYSIGSPAVSVFDDQAVKTSKKTLVDDGVVTSLLHTRETAMKYNDNPGAAKGLFHKPKAMHSTLVVSGGDWRDQEIIEETRKGIFIDGVITAEMMRGIVRIVPEEAWSIEKGELREPILISEVKIPLLQSLTNIDAIGKKTYTRFSYEKKYLVAERAPWIRIKAYVF